MCEVAIQVGFHYIFVCLPQSHQTLYEWLNYLAANGSVNSFQERHRHGRDWHLYNYRWVVNRIPLRDAQPASETNWFELIITRQSDAQTLFQNNRIVFPF
jgi:hypothetical protein